MRMSSNSGAGLISVKEFFRLVPDGQKADLLDGVIYMAAADSRRSNTLTGFVEFLLRGYDGAKNLGGEIFVNRFAFRLSKYRAPEPDVAYVRAARAHLIGETAMKGGPDIAVEVVSRESRKRDYGNKKLIYEKSGVREYWVIDPLRKQVEFYRLHGGRYQPVSLEGKRIFRSQVLPGFWLDIRWLLLKPLPNPYRCLLEVLEGPPR